VSPSGIRPSFKASKEAPLDLLSPAKDAPCYNETGDDGGVGNDFDDD
jgi:hypothetical protein